MGEQNHSHRDWEVAEREQEAVFHCALPGHASNDPKTSQRTPLKISPLPNSMMLGIMPLPHGPLRDTYNPNCSTIS